MDNYPKAEVLFLLGIVLLVVVAIAARAQSVDDDPQIKAKVAQIAERVARQIEETATERKPMTVAAQCPTFTGTVNSGSGIGVSVNWSDSNTATRYIVTRAGIHFTYDGSRRVHSEICGCGFGASFEIRADYPDGSICTISSTGSVPHSAPCTAGNAAYSSVLASAASYSDIVAPGSIAAIFGTNFTAQTQSASALPLPASLGGVKVYTFFNTPLQRECGLFYASPGQVNALLPADLPYGGAATLAVVNLAEDSLRPTWFYSNRIEPAIFTDSQDGHGAAAGYQTQGFWVLYGTGFSNSTSGFLLVNGAHWPAAYQGPAPGFVGLTQINVQANVPHGAQAQVCANIPASTDARCSQVFYLP